MAAAPKKKNAGSAKPDTEPGPPVLAWIMGGLGLALLLTCLAVILSQGLGETRPPDIRPRLVEVRAADGQWLAEIEVRNTGGETAADVQIEGRSGGETASVTVDYVPAGGKAAVVLGFTQNPRSDLHLRVRGWTEP
ncbi:hypothetical protein [uncultured Brevundimonas sp.]|uniref:hypothetical protein n=1 Tax=uncultured Brevundimonas sp. TaxID=213418 RepID=UPI0026362F8A|nr:hypothetical protein [uncultured Brevundimonas sp.]